MSQTTKKSQASEVQAPRGLFIINKPSGITSRRALNEVENRLGLRSLGHCGSLDPLATGVLILVSGKARKLQDLVVKGEKEYDMTVALGSCSDTDDGEGTVVPVEPAPEPPSEETVRHAVAGFVGEILQRPPTYSALKVEGRRMHREARQGRPVEAEPRLVVIHELEVTRYEWPELDIVMRCGSGTYARALARDLGETLGTGGYMSRLVRTRVGSLDLDRAFLPDEVSVDDMLGIEEVLKDMPRINVPLEQRHLLMRGQTLRTPTGFPTEEPCFAWVGGEVVAAVTFVAGGGQFRSKRLLV